MNGAINQSKPVKFDVDSWLDATTCRPCGPSAINTDTTRAPTNWDDFDKHSAGVSCFLSSWMPSFGPLGLMSVTRDENEAFVDTCASMTVTPFREDFLEYETLENKKVLKGLSAGATIQGRGIVHWRLEVGSKVVDLKLRALHVPVAEHRLLCPQQLRKEHKPKLKLSSIEDDGILLEFEEGRIFCPCNESNLP